jgi:polar amino acid transport system permease protein
MFQTFSWFDVMFLLRAAGWTVLLTAAAFIGGSLLGGLMAVMRVSSLAPLRLLAIGYIQLLQGIPLLMQLFLTYFGLSLVGISVPGFAAAGLALSLHSSAFLADIWRGCLESIPRPQWEGSAAIGMSRYEQLRYIIVPQAVRVAIPPTVGFLVSMVKNTSLASIIGFVELARAGQIVNDATFQPIKAFGTVALIYFFLCIPLSILSRHMERSLARRLNVHRNLEFGV